MFYLFNFSSIFPGWSADPIGPYVRTPMVPCNGIDYCNAARWKLKTHDRLVHFACLSLHDKQIFGRSLHDDKNLVMHDRYSWSGGLATQSVDKNFSNVLLKCDD